MDFDFTDDQEQLRDAVRKWVDKGYDFERRRGIEKAGGFSRQAYGELAELGLPGLYIPEEHGGLGMGPVEGMVVMEELGRGIVAEPFTQTLIAGAVLTGYAPDAVKSAWLPKIASGESLVVLAQQERAGRYHLDKCEAKAALANDKWALTAIKSIVPAGDHADAFLVPAMADGQMALFLVERTAAGVTTNGYRTQDGARAAEVSFKDAPATLVTKDGLTALAHAVDIGIAAACAEAVGVMDKTMAITVEYMNTRKQFGVVISSFQALRHRVADMKMQLELARSMSYYASLKLCAGRRTPPRDGARQVPARHVDAAYWSASRSAAWRYCRDGRIHREPLFPQADAAGNDVRRHAASARRGFKADAGHGWGICLTLLF